MPTSTSQSFSIWVDSLRCHSETPGFGIGESDEPFVLVGVIDLDRRNAAGIPSTEVVLYGPLGGVDDQENRSFPFRPFWQRTLRPESAIFLTAILEHDNVNPEVTRTSVAAALQVVAAATAGAPRERIVSESLSAFSAAAEPVTAAGVVNRLIGPPAELRFTPDALAAASTESPARQVLRFNRFGDYSVHYLARREKTVRRLGKTKPTAKPAGWQAWFSHGAPPGGFVGAPSIVSRDGTVCNIYVRGADNALWQKGFFSGSWHDWGRHDDGAVLASEPAPGTMGPTHEHVFVRGTDDSVWSKAWS